MKKVFSTASFFLITPFFLVLCIFYLTYLSYHSKKPSVLAASTSAYTAIPNYNALSVRIEEDDSKTETVRQFFTRYNSPLAEHAHDIVSAAKANNIDFRLIPAIAMQESTGCRTIPKESYNCWGYGIYGGKVLKFDNFKEAIDTVTRAIAIKYIQNGFTTPEEIQKKWTPSNDGSWSLSVNHFMNQLQ